MKKIFLVVVLVILDCTGTFSSPESHHYQRIWSKVDPRLSSPRQPFEGSHRNIKSECTRPPPEIPPDDDISKLSLWDLLKKTESELTIHTGDAIILLGNSGSGKTTVVQTVAGNISNLYVYETAGEDLIIVDPEQKIGLTTESRTLIPELVPDPPNSLYYYDFPGFRDNRGINADITANFLMKKVTDNLSSTRLVFLAISSAVKVGNDKKNFDDLVSHAIQKVKDLDKLQEGIGLIVTKAENYNNQGVFRKDDTIINGIQEFLKQYKEDQEKQINTIRRRKAGVFPMAVSQRDVIERKIRFVEILLQPNKIWFFRIPETCGPLLETSWALENKEAMVTLMRDTLKSIPTDEGDFGYSVSDQSLVEIFRLYQELNSYVTSNITKLSADLKRASFQTTLTLKEFFSQADWIENDYGNFSEVVRSFEGNSSLSPSFLAGLLASAINSRGYDQRWAVNLKSDMERIESYMDFFDGVANEGTTFDRDTSKWLLPLKNWVTQLSQRDEWFSFLFSLRNILSSYNFQKKSNKPLSRPRNIEELKKMLEEDDHIVSSSIISIYNKMESIIPEDVDIMWTLVDEAIEVPKIECDSKSSQMTVKGTFIKATDFVSSSGSYLNCSSPRVVSVYATRMVFFDTNIKPTRSSTNDDPELAIVAPKYEVVDIPGSQKVEVNLKGYEGESPSTFSTFNTHHLSKSISLRETITSIPSIIDYKCREKGLIASAGSNGGAGSPGGPGLPGGNFIGLTASVSNGNKLQISASGGLGGKGAKGVDGGNGQEGKEFLYDWWGKCQNTGPCLANGDCDHQGPCTGNRNSWRSHFDTCYRKGSGVVDCEAAGCLGGHGGSGGDGGVGGIGGYPGSATLVIVPNEDDGQGVGIEVHVGSNGTEGPGGNRGRGGQRGNGWKAGVWEQPWMGCVCSWEDEKRINPRYDQFSPDGSQGTPGANSNGLKFPREPIFTLTKIPLVLAYKAFALPKESDFFPNEFISQLEKTPSVRKEESAIHFAEELLILEEVNLHLKNQGVRRESLTLRLGPRYESYVSRLDNYTQEYTETIPDADRKLISLLYTLSLNQLRTLKMVFGVPVVVNVEGYLESVALRIEDYKKVETSVMIDDERHRYKETYLVKIEQAMVFLVDTVDPALKETYEEIGGITDQLLEAIQRWIEEAEAAEKEYKEALETAKKNMALRSMFNIFAIGGAALSILGGPVGGPIGNMIGTASSIGEQLALDNTGNIRPPNPLPPSIQKYADEMEARNKATSVERQQELETLILESRSAVTDNQEVMDDLETKVAKLEQDKQVLLENGPKGSMKQFQDLNKAVLESEANLKDGLDKRSTNLNNAMQGLDGTPEEQEAAKKHGPKAIEAIKHVESAVKVVANLGLDIYKKYKNDKGEIARLSAMVEEAAKQVESLQLYEQAVNDLLVPFTESIISEMDDAAQQMANQSSVFLRVTQWRVQKTLREYNFFLQDFTQAFPDIARAYALQVENLMEAMTLMIDLYDFIEQYNEQMQFADYIANINSPRAIGASLGEVAASLYQKIEMAMKASLILTEWDRIIQTFQQWVFPFEDAFQNDLKTNNIPDYMAPEIKDVTEMYSFLIPDIQKRVTGLTASLKAYKNAAFEAVDGVLIHNEFNSEKVSTVPFHVWQNEDEERRITELFLGNQITLSLSPEFTYQRAMSAVKFTIAEIEPKARNETVQARLKEELKKLRVIMTHSGVSRYLHEDSMEEMVGGNLTIQFNFERDGDGERLGKNNVYKKLETGDLILSPYTLWTVQLKKAQTDTPFDFNEFSKYAPLVDLELIGKGSFVRQKGTRTLREYSLYNPYPRYFSVWPRTKL